MNKIVLTASLVLFSFSVWATPFGRVVEIKGEGFISHQGKTKDIRVGDIIEMNSEIVIEHAGQVTFTDNADHRFHMGNSSSVAVYNNHIELRSGDLWFQSVNRIDDYKVTTANASVHYQGGEAILSYDSTKGKTQLMVISGMMKIANLRSEALNLSVAEGNFSFVDNAYDEGAPRDPTPVGEKTYKQLITLFKNVTPMEKHADRVFKENDQRPAARGIASVPVVDNKLLEAYKSELLSETKPVVPEVKVVTKKVKPAAKVPPAVTTVDKVAATPLEIKIYGLKQSATTATATTPTKGRAPASVLDEPVSAPEYKLPTTIINEHQKESDQLLNRLNSL